MVLILTTFLLMQDSVFADTTIYKTYYFEGIEITATRYTKFPELSTAGIDIIDGNILKLQNPGNVGEALYLVPGINVLNYTVKNETKLGIRGLGFKHNMIMINGTPVANPWDNSTILNEISLYHVKRIEVIKGSSTLSYGPNTLGGVVNIITEGVKGNQIQFDIEKGNFGYQSYILSGA
ncbi:Plug domain-containing protein, partial [candidate division WOR-3 bacterium]|nr:Plug domain-containing protein [candidate division WOR-3 bacterium]